MTTQISPLDLGAEAPATSPSAAHARNPELWRDLAPLCVIVFMEFLAMGLPLTILPVHVHQTLGFGSFVVGLVIGVQSWATLLTRHAAGTRADQRGPRSATALGLWLSALAGTLFATSEVAHVPALALALIVAGRLLLGVGESLVITGALSWGVALAGRERSGVVMSWVGVAMYGALAAGAPLGSAIADRLGFAGAAAATALSPVLGVGALRLARGVAPVGGVRLGFYRVIRLILLPGSGLAFGALGFGSIAAFSALRFAEAGWSHAALALSAFGAAYVLARVLFARLPDRLGGARVAMASAALAAAGQLGLWLATSGAVAIAAAALTGLGFSLAFPAFGVEAVRRVPPQSRGVALGAYSACFDLSMGLGVPLLGIVVGLHGYQAAFGVGSIAALSSLVVAVALWSSNVKSAASRS